MSKQLDLEQRLFTEFQPHFLRIENESHMHSSNRSSESHFKVVLVSERFDGMRQVARHQMVYKLLTKDLSNGIHALALHTYTPAEWNSLKQTFPVSPKCVGVGL